jgi:putative ABC transport system ATP-binding protein
LIAVAGSSNRAEACRLSSSMTQHDQPFAIVVRDVSKRYRLDSISVDALLNISLQIPPNRFTVIAGPSGSGKTTLLNVIGCIDRPDQGEVVIQDQIIKNMADDALSDFRARHIGFVFQNFNLLPVLSAYENVEFPLLLGNVVAVERKRRVLDLLEAVGLKDRAQSRPSQLSGGQRQRVAIARALATQPALVIADEPTANLDSQTGSGIIALMRQMQREHRTSFIVSSHDPQVLKAADDAIVMLDGRVSDPAHRGP